MLRDGRLFFDLFHRVANGELVSSQGTIVPHGCAAKHLASYQYRVYYLYRPRHWYTSRWHPCLSATYIIQIRSPAPLIPIVPCCSCCQIPSPGATCFPRSPRQLRMTAPRALSTRVFASLSFFGLPSLTRQGLPAKCSCGPMSKSVLFLSCGRPRWRSVRFYFSWLCIF